MADKRTYVLTYSYAPEMLERRQPHRQAHLEYVLEAQAAGFVRMAGAFADPVDGALTVIRAETLGEVFAWVGQDPYARAGLIYGMAVREWTMVAGADLL